MGTRPKHRKRCPFGRRRTWRFVQKWKVNFTWPAIYMRRLVPLLRTLPPRTYTSLLPSKPPYAPPPPKIPFLRYLSLYVESVAHLYFIYFYDTRWFERNPFSVALSPYLSDFSPFRCILVLGLRKVTVSCLDLIRAPVWVCKWKRGTCGPSLTANPMRLTHGWPVHRKKQECSSL